MIISNITYFKYVLTMKCKCIPESETVNQTDLEITWQRMYEKHNA